MTDRSIWQQAWDSAQPKISSIRDSLNFNSPLNSRIIRVGQLDSELLDQELVHLLQEPLNKALSLFNVCCKQNFFISQAYPLTCTQFAYRPRSERGLNRNWRCLSS